MRRFSFRPALLGVVFSLAACPVVAQVRGFGVKAGVDVATEPVTPADESTQRRWYTGLVAGAFYTQPLVSRFDMQVDALYAAKGARVRIAGLNQTIQIDYVEVPVLFRAHAGRYYAAAGPSAAIRLRARARISFPGSIESVDIGNEVERADYGVAAGGGVDFRRFVFDVRYTHGIKDIDADRTDASHTKNRTVAITAGVRF
jgi:Outer membrane protein beta-barrel domain